MTYNTDRRKPLRGDARRAFLEAHGCRCHWCGELIVDDQWDDEHVIPREMFPPGGDADAMSNRAPIHRRPCHKAKTAHDRRVIAKSNRIRRRNGPIEQRRKPRQPMRSRKTNWPKRPLVSRNEFKKRGKR